MEHNVVYIGNDRCRLYVGSSRRCVVTESALPYDAEVEYLQSDGNQWIELGIYGSPDLDFTIDFEPLDLVDELRSWTGTGSYFGVRSGGNYELSGYNRTNLDIKGCFFWYNRGEASGYTVRVGLTASRVTASKSGSVFTRPSGATVSMTGYSGWVNPTTQTIALFARKTSDGGTAYPGKMKLYSIKFEKNGVTLLDLVPVRVGTIGYMYDKVSGQLFGNAGTGNFILGNDKT